MWTMRKFWKVSCAAGSLAALLLLGTCGPSEESVDSIKSGGKEYLVYFGTSTQGESQGIYVSRFTPETGEVSSPELAAEASNPGFLAIHPNQKLLYAVGQSRDQDGKPIGTVAGFEIDPATGKLTRLNEVSSGGAGPCHLNVDKTGQAVAVANYGSGSVAALPLSADGHLLEASAFVQHEGSSVDPERQAEPHAHSVNFSPDNRFLIAADLGLDKLLVYRFRAEDASLTPNDPAHAALAPGAGPRHFTFHTSGRFAYAINEMASTVTAFSYDAVRGAFEELQTITTLPEDFDGASHTAEVLVHPSGRFLYGSNRGHNSIAVFTIDEGKGTLTPAGQVSTQGDWPRNFRIDPTGRYLFAANQRSDNVVVFRIDQASGRLTATGQVISVDSPMCVRFVELD